MIYISNSTHGKYDKVQNWSKLILDGPLFASGTSIGTSSTKQDVSITGEHPQVTQARKRRRKKKKKFFEVIVVKTINNVMFHCHKFGQATTVLQRS